MCRYHSCDLYSGNWMWEILYRGVRNTLHHPLAIPAEEKNTQAYEYSVKLYAPIHEAEDTLMLFTKGESTSEFSYDGSPREHLQLWVDNMNRREEVRCGA